MQLNICIINDRIKLQSLHILKVHTNKRKSFIRVVEDNGEDCIGHHDKKGGDGQDPSFWRRKVTFSLPATNLTSHEKQNKGNPNLFSQTFS